jgi:hypothetical protein
VPHRSTTHTGASSPSRKSFRQRYDELEARCFELIARLTILGENARRHPAYKRSLKLLNETFRKGRLAQRLAVLEAAAFLINMLAKLPLDDLTAPAGMARGPLSPPPDSWTVAGVLVGGRRGC